DLVADRLPAARDAEAPAVLLEEMLGAVRGRAERRLLASDANRVRAAGPAQPILGRNAGGVRADRAVERGRAVRLVVDQAGQPDDQARRYELADEYDAALAAVADVKAQIEFGKVAVARPRHAKYARVEELKRHETDKRLPVAGVQFQARRQQFV